MLCEVVFNYMFFSHEKSFPWAGSDSARPLMLLVRHQCLLEEGHKHPSDIQAAYTEFVMENMGVRAVSSFIYVCTHIPFLHQVSKINFLNPSLSLDWRHLLKVTRKI